MILQQLQAIANLLSTEMPPKEVRVLYIGDSRFWAILTSLKDWEYKLSSYGLRAFYTPEMGKYVYLFINGRLSETFKIIYE